MEPKKESEPSSVSNPVFEDSSKYISRSYLFAVVVISGIILKVFSDLLAWKDVFGARGALLSLTSSVLLFISILAVVKLSVPVTVIAFVNAALCYHVANKLLEHSDVFGTDPWLIVSVWIWVGTGLFCLLRILFAAMRKISSLRR